MVTISSMKGTSYIFEATPYQKHMSNSTKQPQKILILSLSGIGNLLMQLPTIEALKKLYPHSHITVWVTPRGTKAIAQNSSAIDKIIVAKTKRVLAGHLLQTLRLRHSCYDTTIMLYPGQLWKGALYMLTTGAGNRIAHTYPHLGNPTSSFLLTDPITIKPGLHDIQQNLNLLKPFSSNKQNQISLSITYKLTIPPKNQQLATKLLNKIKITNNRNLIGFHPGSSPDSSWKRWPLENFAALAYYLITNHNSHILIFGGPDENKLKHQLSSLITTKYSLPLNSHSTISTDLLTCAAITQKCVLFISNDSGLMHLSAASGVKTFGLFGPTDETRSAPRGIDSHVIRAPGTSPTFDINENHDFGAAPHQTMLAITPQLVINTIKPAVPSTESTY